MRRRDIGPPCSEMTILDKRGLEPIGSSERRALDMATRPGGRVVLLTGAAGGIGAAITGALLAEGHAIAAVNRDAASLDRLADAHKADRLHPIVAELTSERE